MDETHYVKYSARLLSEEIPQSMVADLEYQIPLRLRNTGNIKWSNNFNLAYHWLDPSGEIIVFEGLRTAFHRIINPNEEIDIVANVRSPSDAGNYILMFDIVQEGVTWFRDKGSETVPFKIIVQKEYMFSIFKKCKNSLYLFYNIFSTIFLSLLVPPVIALFMAFGLIPFIWRKFDNLFFSKPNIFPKSKLKLCIVTRPDLFPTTHGGAVKTISTAKFLSIYHDEIEEVILLTANSDIFYQVDDGVFNEMNYPSWIKIIPKFNIMSRLLLSFLGIPKEEVWMYSTLLDFNLWIKVLFITFTHKTEVLQSDYPGFAFSFLLPKLIFGTFTSLSEHNVEYIRLADTFSLSLLGNVTSRNLEKFICMFVDIIITVSSVDRDNLIKLDIKKGKIFVIASGVDVARFEGIEADEIKKIYGMKGPVLIFHGTLHYKPNKKAVEIISKHILPRLRQEGVHVKFLIVGSSPPIEYSDKDIIFTGVVDEEDLPKYIMAADLAVVPLLAGGGTRLKILEYFAAKKPVISTSKGAEGLNVTNGKEIVIEDDLDKFINEIIYLINSRDRQECLANNAYEFVKQYDWRNLSLEYISLYKRRK